MFTDIKNTLPFLPIGLSVLRSLWVRSCYGFECLIYVEEWAGQLPPPQAMVLSNLEKLYLTNLDSFKGILNIGHQLPLTRKVFDFGKRGILHNLREVHIKGCRRLKSLFQPCLAQNFHQLEVLYISECEELEEIVAKENQWQQEEDDIVAAADKMVVVFKSVRVLELEKLPSLDGFCTGSFLFEWPSLTKLSVNKCPKMKTFTATATSEFKSAPNLKQITLDYTKKNLDGADINTVIQKHFRIRGNAKKG